MQRLKLTAAFCLLASPLAAEEVVVFAAASLKTALDPVAEAFTNQSGHEVTISYAGSNALAKQIIQGAPADIFLSAAVNWMDEVEAAGLISAGTRHDFLGNRLVLLAHGKDQAPIALSDLPATLGERHLAMALVDAVPAGQYGKAALTALGQWDDLSPRVAQAENVRAALMLVASGEAPFGITYATDAHASDNVTIVASFPKETHPAITYPAALLTAAKDEADQAFFTYLSTPEAAKFFTEQGFDLLK